jgi:ATP-dependent exoDNAse (exonuclease V) beta subunit
VIPCFASSPGAGAYAILSEALPEVDRINPGEETKGMFVIDADDLPEAPPEDKPFQWQKARKKDEQAVERMKAEKGDWIKGHEQARERARQGISITRPSEMSGDEGHELTRDYETLQPRGKAMEIGIAVHQVLELLDPAHPERAGSLAHAVAREKGLEKDLEEIKRLVSKAIQSSAYKRAVASGRMFREVPYTWWKSENEVSSGKMDLVFEEPDGLVIVDYKTDRVSEKDLETVPEKYRIQGQEYKQALEALSGKPVKEIIFLFLQEIFSGDTIHIS